MSAQYIAINLGKDFEGWLQLRKQLGIRAPSDVHALRMWDSMARGWRCYILITHTGTYITKSERISPKQLTARYTSWKEVQLQDVKDAIGGVLCTPC